MNIGLYIGPVVLQNNADRAKKVWHKKRDCRYQQAISLRYI